MTVRLTLDRPQSWTSRNSLATIFSAVDALPLSGKARYLLENTMSWAVSEGLNGVDHPSPFAELEVALTRFEIEPPFQATATAEDVERLRLFVFSAVKGIVTALWGGIVALWQQERYLELPTLGKEWFVAQAHLVGGTITTSVTGDGYPSREVAERALTSEERAAGYRVVEARDRDAAGEAYLGLPEPAELRFGRDCLTLAAAQAVQVGDEVFHLGRREKAQVRQVSFPSPDLPRFDVGHGPEVYTLFGELDEE